MAYDLAYYDREISQKGLVIRELQNVINTYNTTIQKCKDAKEGLFSVYSCNRNTGKTIDEWRDARKLVEMDLAQAESDLAMIKQEREYAVTAISENAQAYTQQAQLETAEATASTESAKKYGTWIGVAAIVLVFGYFAVKKLRS